MIKHTLYIFGAIICFLFVLGCSNSKKDVVTVAENKKAKAMLEGIWLDEDEENVTFKIKGDTVYYPDSTSQPVMFKIIGDTMFFYGNSVSKYPILKQSPHIFEFKNQNGDVVKLVKSNDPNDALLFVHHAPIILNQNKVIKRDTIVGYSDKKYHCYVQINPTTYKVYRTFYNDEGLEVENIYYDNIIHVSIFSGSVKLFSKDFRKDDFSTCVPKNMLKQSVLSDIDLDCLDENGVHYQTQLAIPDCPTSFLVKLTISYSGNITMSVAQ